VSHAAIITSGRAETLARLASERLVLLVQDTTSLDFSHHPGTAGLGPLENAHCRGFLAHSTLAVSQVGVPLGLMEQQVWVRREEDTGQRAQRHARPLEAKESYKWVKGLPGEAASVKGVQYVTVCDAEGHIYEFLDRVVEQGLDFIVRAADARSFTVDDQSLFEAVAHQPVQDQYSLSLKRRPDREARPAQVDLRFGSLTLRRPQRAQTLRHSLSLFVVDVVEPNPPPGQQAVHWLLLTSLPVHSLDQAHQIATWYTYRWLVERFHYVLKSGCKLEERQLREEVRLERLLAVFSLVAWRLLWLTYQARLTPDLPATVALQPVEWQALCAFMQRSPALPRHPSPSATRWSAGLLNSVASWAVKPMATLASRSSGAAGPAFRTLSRPGLSRCLPLLYFSCG